MIQFNLLPDVKLEFIKARRLKRLVLLSSVGLSALSLFILILVLVSVDVVQKKSLSDLNKDIKSNTQQLKNTPNLDKILTVQNQLNTLTSLHDQKVVSSRLFTYISQITPAGVTISSLNVDFVQNTMTMTGAAPDLVAVNRFIDTIKATQYTTDSNNTPTKAFSSVVLNSFSRGEVGGTATYGTNFSFDPAIFSNTQKVSLTVPSGTVSNTSVLFKSAEKK